MRKKSRFFHQNGRKKSRFFHQNQVDLLGRGAESKERPQQAVCYSSPDENGDRFGGEDEK